MKRKYEKPSMKVYEIGMSRLVCTSGGDDNWGYIPGQPRDEKHLA